MIFNSKTDKPHHILHILFQISPSSTMRQLFLSFLTAIIPTAVMALVTAAFVDTAIAILQNQRPHQYIYDPLIWLFAVLAVRTTAGDLSGLLGSRLSLDVQRSLHPALVDKHAKLAYKHIEHAESWELITRVTRDPAIFVMDGFNGYVQMMQIIVSVVSILGLIVSKAWWAALVIIVFSIPLFLLSLQAGRKNYQAGRDAEKFHRRTEYLSEVISGRDAVDERTLFGYGEELQKNWQEQYEAGRKLQLRVSAKRFIITKGSSLILALISLIVALALINPVLTGHMTVGLFMGIISAVFGLVQQLGWKMAHSLESISRAGEYMKDLSAFLSLSETPDASCSPDEEPPAFTTLEFRNVSFRYPGGDHYILEGLSFTLTGGRHYAFVGKNGAGKTTITKLLTGLYDEYEGEILINGKELREYPAGTVKAMFSVVYQDFSRYYITLKENIMLGDIAAADTGSRVPSIIGLAGLEDTAADLKNGVDTPLGRIREGGQDMSGGQWQRVAIARSLISRAPVKILDEPTAALDPISESRVYEEFEKLMAGKTTVFISHRLGSTKLADEILVIDDGRIVERGGHGDLLSAAGLYASMFESQRGWYQ